MNNTLQGEQPTIIAAESEQKSLQTFKILLNRLFARLKAFPGKRVASFKESLSRLTFSQWMYLLAFCSLIFTADATSEDLDSFLMAGIIAGLGLIRELWYLFMRIWAHTAGKGLLFVLYAATANFALAVSALKINSISGVEPTVFIFTMGFTTLLMLPFWLILASMVFLGTALVVGNFWLLIALILRLVGIRLPTHWEDQSFAVLTLILRIILIPALLWALAAMLNPYIKQLDMFGDTMGFQITDNQQLTAEQLAALQQMPEEQIGAALDKVKRMANAPATQGSPDNKTSEELTEALKNFSPEQLKALQVLQGLSITAEDAQLKLTQVTTTDNSQDQAAGLKWLDIMVSQFIYRFETYPYSACAKKPEQRVLTINENLVFVAEPDKNYETGLKFSATECVPRNSAHEKGLKRDVVNVQKPSTSAIPE